MAAYQGAEAMNGDQPAQAMVYGGGTGAAAAKGQAQTNEGGRWWLCFQRSALCYTSCIDRQATAGHLVATLPVQDAGVLLAAVRKRCGDREAVTAGKPSIEGRKELEADPTNAAPTNSGNMGTGNQSCQEGPSARTPMCLHSTPSCHMG